MIHSATDKSLDVSDVGYSAICPPIDRQKKKREQTRFSQTTVIRTTEYGVQLSSRGYTHLYLNFL